MKLTVIIRDDAPLIYADDTPSYRTAVIELSDKQAEKLKLRDKTEHISRAILEDETHE